METSVPIVIYSSLDELPRVGSPGQFAVVEEGSQARVFLWSGTAWLELAVRESKEQNTFDVLRVEREAFVRGGLHVGVPKVISEQPGVLVDGPIVANVEDASGYSSGDIAAGGNLYLGGHAVVGDVAPREPVSEMFVKGRLTSQEFSGWQNMLFSTRYVAGELMWAYVPATGSWVWGTGHSSAAVWSHAGLGFSRSFFGAVQPELANEMVGGGPYVYFNGVDNYAYVADASWQEWLGNPSVVYGWVCLHSMPSTGQRLVAKWNWDADVSWLVLARGAGSMDWQFYVCGTGSGADAKSVSSTETWRPHHWYFVAGLYWPGQLIRIYWARADETQLKSNTNTSSIPSSLKDTVAPLMIGAGQNSGSPGGFLHGCVGVWACRSGQGLMSPEHVDRFLDHVFQTSRLYYLQGPSSKYVVYHYNVLVDTPLSVGTYTYTVRNFGIPSVGIPNSAKALAVRLTSQWSTANNSYWVGLTPAGRTSPVYSVVRAEVANIQINRVGVVPLDGIGKFSVRVDGADTVLTSIRIVGYFE